MKQGYKIAIGSLILASALIACGKKGGSKAAAPTASATSAGCTLNSQGYCVGATGGFLGMGDGKARIVVSNVAKFHQMLLDNGMCSGPMNIAIYPPNRRTGLPCNMASNYFDVQVQSVDNEPLPKPVNFDVRAFIAGRRVDLAGNRMTQADIYGLSNGYQIIFNRLQGGGYGVPYYRHGYRPGYPVPIQQTVPAATTNTLTVVLTASDATRTIFTAVVSYQGVQIGSGTLYGSFQQGQLAYGSAPATAPYQGQPYDRYYNAK